MQVRYPNFDFTGSQAIWADSTEMVVIINAGAIVPPPIERYLNWVFAPDYDPGRVPAPRDYEAVLAPYTPAA